MNFKTDENMPGEVAELLRRRGDDALSVGDQRLAGHPDIDVAAACRAERRALITLDLDFADVRVYPPSAYSGLIVLRPRVQNVTAIVRLAEQMVRYLDTEPLAGHLWIVEEHRVRVRGGGANGPP